ncbi:EmrB/QacA subfamily drug resistance transporter [Actinomadura pelletieri DSM 43383]|uniref:EmrB/QacA subfamily drug resistance transporter n=1 Tax=Actinomadura pelletieri DSM 43383 TaxID=1120940 RepID=A0A495QH45_9ACTN|nr:DHA2 family efflux MFS transporter permease subunit [Actinomadura pelletieri]RKS71214.1 EmrB/QacA subfamily drug resistance transporter [Actinomadura pelletieri DSM 43383]
MPSHASSRSLSFLRSRWAALGVLSTTMLMTILDGSIVTVAAPAIRDDLGFSPAGLSWIMNAYLIPLGGLLLLAGRLGDLIGRRTLFLTGNAVFTAASVLAGAATSSGVLIAARFLQGVGSALASAVVLGILVTLFTDPRERTMAIGIFSFTGAAGASIGQVLGGVLTDALNWHWIFLVNLPIGLATILLALPALPRDRGLGLAAGADVAGALLVTSGLVLGIYTIVKVERYEWLSAHTLGLGAVSLALLAGFVVRQARAATPLMPLRILRSRNVSGAYVVQLLTLSAMFAFQVIVALYMQGVLGYGALDTGLAMLPAAVMIGVVSLLVSPRMSNRFGERAVLITGLVLLVVAMGWLTTVPARADYVTDLLPAFVLIAGAGLVLPSLTGLGMSSARPDDAGVASGLFNTVQQVGMALGVAVLTTLAASRTENLRAAGRDEATALTGGYHLAFGVSAALLVAALAVSILVLRRPRPVASETPRPISAEGRAEAVEDRR